MPASLIDTSHVVLDEAEERFLRSKRPGTGNAYRSSLKRFKAFYLGGIAGFIHRIEQDEEDNKARSTVQRVRPGEDVLRSYVSFQLENGYSNKSVLSGMAALQNALKYYGRNVSFTFVDLPLDRTMKRNKKHEWTIDQIKQFVEKAEYLRDKCYILFAFQSGLSISDILNLNYGDIQREFEAGIMPLAIEGHRQKTGIPIRTFIGRDAVHYLRLYLGSRVGIGFNDPIFTQLGSNKRANPGSIQKKLREYASKLDFIFEEDMNGHSPVRAHSLRAAFRSRLTGRMDDTLIEMFMSHDIGHQIATYINMPLDELREIYASYEHLLTIEKTSKDERTGQDVPESFKRQLVEIQQENMNTQNELRTKIAEIESKLLIATSKIESGSGTIKVLEEKMDKLIYGIEKLIQS